MIFENKTCPVHCSQRQSLLRPYHHDILVGEVLDPSICLDTKAMLLVGGSLGGWHDTYPEHQTAPAADTIPRRANLGANSV